MFGSNVFVCTLSNMKKYKRRLVTATIFKNKNSRKSITIDDRSFIDTIIPSKYKKHKYQQTIDNDLIVLERTKGQTSKKGFLVSMNTF